MDGSAAEDDGCFENTCPGRVCAPDVTGCGNRVAEKGQGMREGDDLCRGRERGRSVGSRGWISEDVAGWMVPRHGGRWRGMRCGMENGCCGRVVLEDATDGTKGLERVGVAGELARGVESPSEKNFVGKIGPRACFTHERDEREYNM